MPAQPSRFLDELPAQHVEWPGGRAPPPPRPRVEAVQERTFVPDAEDYLDVEAGPRLPRPGAQVRHAHFGAGVVLEVRGSGGRARITVRFERFGDKQLMAEYARLEEVF
jgi:DNA helicase-2/ATP-dependent DNA helicase PcrA